MVKPSIRKQDGRWVLTRPGYGFSSQPSVTACESWEDARRRLLGPAVASAGAQVERGYHTLPSVNQRGYAHRGTIRMEDTA